MGQFFLSGGAGSGPSGANAQPVHMLKYALFDPGIAQNDNVKYILNLFPQGCVTGSKILRVSSNVALACAND